MTQKWHEVVKKSGTKIESVKLTDALTPALLPGGRGEKRGQAISVHGCCGLSA